MTAANPPPFQSEHSWAWARAPMGANEFRRLGERLAKLYPETYGRGWQSALAREFGVTLGAVRSWLRGKPISESVAEQIRRVADEEIG